MVEMMRFAPGMTLMNEGEVGDVAYVIQKGQVRISKESPVGPQEIAVVGPGQVIGEMALVDDKPRSATATAINDVQVKPIQRDRLLDLLRKDADLALSLLQVLFERLRVSQNMIVSLRAQADKPVSDAVKTKPKPKAKASEAEDLKVRLRALTPEARKAISGDELALHRLPFRIGRVSDDPLSRNDLAIADKSPFQISRCHIAIYRDEDLMAVTDRGSRDGFVVNGRRYGGEGNPNRITYLQKGINRLSLGDDDSPFRFELIVT